MIIIGYQGIGKSTISGVLNCIDLECGNFYVGGCRQEDWYKIYANIALDISRQGYVVLTPSHAALRRCLHDKNKTGERIFVCFPALELKSDWIERLQQRYISEPSDKNLRALANAKERYAENIAEIKDDAERFGFGVIEIGSMDYSLCDMIRGVCNKKES